MCPERQLLRSLSDGLSITSPNKVYAKFHGITLSDGVKMGFYANPFYGTRKDRRR
jgi:hypothetical protein